MDGHFGRLPVEVQERIFDSFSGKADLLECQLTCKLWNKHSNRALYKRVIFDYTNIEKADRFIKTLNKYGKDLTVLVKHVKMKYVYDFENQQQVLLKFFVDNCPNIQTYVGETMDESYLGGLNFENWKHLEKFAFSGSDESKQLVEIVKKHKGTIKELELRESIIPTLCNEKENKQEFREKIAEFKSLEKIIITLEHSCHLPSLDNMIPANVKSLILESDCFRNEQNTIDPQYIDLREITPCPNIKELRLRIPLSDENSIKYLMHKFPKLEKLFHRDSKIVTVSENTRAAFTDYLLNIKNTNFTYTLVCNSDSPMDYFFIKKLIESSKANNSKKQRDFAVILSTENTFINKVKIYKESDNSAVSYQISVGLEKLQKLNFLQNFGADLTGLDVRKSDGNDDVLDLNKIFKHCPNLNSLEVEGCDSTLDEELKGNTTNLEALEYLGSERFTPEILSKRSKRFPNLTDLIFVGSEDKAIDLSSIITAFPNLKSLEIKYAEIFLSNADRGSSTLENLDLNKCKLPSNGFFSDLSCCLPNIYELKLCINAEDLKYNTLILDMPETSLQGLSIYVRPSGHCQPHSLFKISLSVGDKETGSNKRYYLGGGYLGNKMKKCTKVEYESVTEDSNVFSLLVNCKELPIIMESAGCPLNLSFKVGTFVY